MIIETVNNPEYDTEIKFEFIQSGIVFEFEDGTKALKLQGGNYVLLTYGNAGNRFFAGEGLMAKEDKITKVWGRLVGLKVQL